MFQYLLNALKRSKYSSKIYNNVSNENHYEISFPKLEEAELIVSADLTGTTNENNISTSRTLNLQRKTMLKSISTVKKASLAIRPEKIKR